jgi:hypothetical protein
MKRPGVPKRILQGRRLREVDLLDVSRFYVVESVRMLRKWLADPAVPDDLREGDADLVAHLEAHLAERPRPTISINTREELEMRKAIESSGGQTRH